MSGIPDVEAAEFAEYLQDERERRTRDSRSRGGGMYHRAMMRAYAESVGADPELAILIRKVTVDVPAEAAPASAAPPPLTVPSSSLLPSELLPAAPARPSPSLQRHGAPPRPFIGLAALALLVLASGVIWSAIGGDAQPVADVLPAAAANPQPAAHPSQPARVAESIPAARPAAVPTAAPARTLAAEGPLATEGTLSITSQPAGARVTVNGIGWGETPVTIRHLEFGPKRIRLTMQGYVSEERVAYLSAGEPVAGTRIVLRRRLSPATLRPPIAGAR